MTTHALDPYQPSEVGDRAELVGKCRQCGLDEAAHGALPDHPEEDRLRRSEFAAATTLSRLARRSAQALRDHNRIEAVVLLSQLELTVDRMRLAMAKAIEDQMAEVPVGGEG